LRRYEKLLNSELEKIKSEGFKLPKYFKDRRTDEEYVYDIIDGWAMEDLICDAWLRPRLIKANKGIEIKVMGTNRDRVIQKISSKKITTNPDFIYNLDGKDTGIELQMARSEIKDGYDMKDTKVQRAIKNGSYFLWVIVPSDKFFIINPQEDLIKMKTQPNPAWGGKMVYHISQEFIKKNGGYSRMIDGINSLHISKLKLTSGEK
jgi:hypothetical protein